MISIRIRISLASCRGLPDRPRRCLAPQSVRLSVTAPTHGPADVYTLGSELLGIFGAVSLAQGMCRCMPCCRPGPLAR